MVAMSPILLGHQKLQHDPTFFSPSSLLRPVEFSEQESSCGEIVLRWFCQAGWAPKRQTALFWPLVIHSVGSAEALAVDREMISTAVFARQLTRDWPAVGPSCLFDPHVALRPDHQKQGAAYPETVLRRYLPSSWPAVGRQLGLQNSKRPCFSPPCYAADAGYGAMS